jgi:hypothetical protein
MIRQREFLFPIIVSPSFPDRGEAGSKVHPLCPRKKMRSTARQAACGYFFSASSRDEPFARPEERGQNLMTPLLMLRDCFVAARRLLAMTVQGRRAPRNGNVKSTCHVCHCEEPPCGDEAISWHRQRRALFEFVDDREREKALAKFFLKRRKFFGFEIGGFHRDSLDVARMRDPNLSFSIFEASRDGNPA